MLTRSLCPTCKNEIPATIDIGDSVIMNKICPVHGSFSGVVEESPMWFEFCKLNNSPKIYDGYMVDVTPQCNLSCKYCYHDNCGDHPQVNDIIDQIKKYAHLAPIILTGGEPTLHPDIELILSETVKTGPFWLLTNGVRLSDPCFYNRILPYIDNNGTLMVGLSFHNESNGKDRDFLELCRLAGKRIGTAFYVIDNINQMDGALAVFENYSDVIASFRIKAASNLGRENKATKHIFTSQMVKHILSLGGSIDNRYSNKISYASMVLNGKEIRLISWYDKHNIDLLDIDGPPYYMSKDGGIHNLVTTCILDEPCTQ